jgi:hypothetical protein
MNPAIGVSLLKSRLNEEDIPCNIKYFNIDFAEMIGLGRYEKISGYGTLYLVERLFAQEYFAKKLPDEQEYIRYLKQTYRVPREYLDHFFSIKMFISPFIDRCMESISWEHYDFIGFSTMFEQNLASIALAHRIKLFDPTKIIVFGGANCEAEGITISKTFFIL